MTTLKYVIKYVSDMDTAVAFFRDQVGLVLRFSSPHWSEFDTGETTLALHAANDEHPEGSAQVGFGVDDLDAFYAARTQAGIQFIAPPTEQFGAKIAKFQDPDGAECSVSG